MSAGKGDKNLLPAFRMQGSDKLILLMIPVLRRHLFLDPDIFYTATLTYGYKECASRLGLSLAPPPLHYLAAVMRFLRSAVISLAAIFAAVEANTTVKQFKQRSLVDVCANVNADLNILGDLFGRIELCICLSAVSQIITTNPIMKNAALLYGNAAVTAALNNIVRRRSFS